jgi:hypothetical protein
MKRVMSSLSHLLVGFISGLALLTSFGLAEASSTSESIEKVGSNPLYRATDQMVCHVGKILTVLNENHSKKSLTCMKRSTRKTHDYNNLADIYAEGWIVVDINNVNTWVFNK